MQYETKCEIMFGRVCVWIRFKSGLMAGTFICLFYLQSIGIMVWEKPFEKEALEYIIGGDFNLSKLSLISIYDWNTIRVENLR